jgi:lipoprotein-anchoring transpeptidase ErfK/SrfK
MNIGPLDSKFCNSRIMRVSGHRILSAASAHVKVAEQRFKSVGFWQIAVLTAAGTLGAASQADAALFYYQDSDSGYSRPAPPVQPRRQRNTRKNSAGKQAAEKETGAKPQGPLIIAVSVDKQKVRIYDSHGLFAESPVSTGMKGHSTPMGVFSIIQKHKFHHSNIYSGAPMPYMQRITWSGIAMHAGVLPGYPASHGCIRMPMAFAIKMWNWTKMGARVVVTPGEMTPASFSHPLLVAQKVSPQPVVADEPKSDLIKSDLPKADMPAVKSDKGADAGPAIKSENSVANLELRSTVGHASPLREQTHTADASGGMPAANAAVTMSDATGGKPSSSEAVSTEARPEAPKSESRPEAESTSANSADTASSDNKSAEASTADAKSDETGSVEKKTDEAQAPIPPAAKTETASDGAKVQEKAEDKPVEGKVEAKSAEKPDEAKTDAAKAEVKTEPVTVEAARPEVTKADASAASDAKKDTARLPGVEKAAAAKAEPKRTGQIAVFVSRKDSKLYVRQNFAPLFDVPITIAPSDRPLGTHVFTAEADKSDPNLLRWSVVTLPVTARNAARNDADDDRPARRHKMAGGAPAEVKPRPVPDSPAEALDRIAIPQDAMARITEALTTGSSIIVSDQGINQGETGEGTDFIVSLR